MDKYNILNNSIVSGAQTTICITRFGRYQEYYIEETKDQFGSHIKLIKPTPLSREQGPIEFFNPFDFNDLFLELCNISGTSGTEDQDILRFCNKYGLLGLSFLDKTVGTSGAILESKRERVFIEEDLLMFKLCLINMKKISEILVILSESNRKRINQVHLKRTKKAREAIEKLIRSENNHLADYKFIVDFGHLSSITDFDISTYRYIQEHGDPSIFTKKEESSLIFSLNKKDPEENLRQYLLVLINSYLTGSYSKIQLNNGMFSPAIAFATLIDGILWNLSRQIMSKEIQACLNCFTLFTRNHKNQKYCPKPNETYRRSVCENQYNQWLKTQKKKLNDIQ
ncbi:hypothetical protein [Ammoniphilus sp. CFH 90114]|uniref:hypothetical protein n=1 Tax=Ammoniphilus sp. CFH 90114 TaxID=2493665 RepID=UPI00100E15C3|nr:hypothetical protein [Ammoniphilus sp. CFH 90114]RXT14858.1 hypothetical protein EIZ39_01205 [Ammoniphilus sp. CFH 90114]